MKIGIIGAGAAGLVTLKYVLEQGHDGIIFEQTDKVGGTWNYTDNTITDDYGLPVHSSMYQGLRTNLPSQLMEYQDFHYEEKSDSFISQLEVLDYMQKYYHHFHLEPHLKFLCHVLKITPLQSSKKWEIQYKDLHLNKLITSNDFDIIIICIGNYSVPELPTIPGSEYFNGQSNHSHYFRKPDAYKGKKVLIIGAGPSGVDISRIISTVADKVYLSYETKRFGNIAPAVISKPCVISFENNKAIFNDGTEAVIDNVIYCTGYKYSYPFLGPECGIKVENKWVKYVYKHIVNVEHPTMAFIGIPTAVCPFPMFDMQIRFYLAFLKQKTHLNKEEMINEILADCQWRKEELQWSTKFAHKMTNILHERYFNDLADTVSIKRSPEVIHKLYDSVVKNRVFAMKKYQILNDKEFMTID